jgi:hypothetical protein
VLATLVNVSIFLAYGTTAGAAEPGRDHRHPHAPTAEPGGGGPRLSARCAAWLSGQAIKEFMAKYPVANSPEPNGA